MSRRFGPAVVVFALVAAAAIALVVEASGDRRNFAFTNTVRAEKVAATVVPGAETCQRDVETYASSNEVRLVFGTFRKPGPRLRLTVSDSGSGRSLADGVLAAGYRDNRGAVTRLSRRLPGGRLVDVCVRNTGGRRVAIYGAPDVDYYVNPSHAYLRQRSGGSLRPTGNDLDLSFYNSRPRTVLSRIPAIFRRAVPFHPGWVGAWTFWVLLAGLVLAAPALVAVAIRAAEREGADEA